MNHLVGLSALELLQHLPSLLSKSVSALTFRIYTQLERPGTETAERAGDRGGRWKSSWEDVVLGLEDEEGVEPIVRRLLRHDTAEELGTYFTVGLERLGQGEVSAILGRLEKHQILALCSRCHLSDGSLMHIPMIDFRCPPGDIYQRAVSLALTGLGQRRGALLVSGNSYHYYGFDLLTEVEFRHFASQCLLLTPLADPRYFGHRLLSGAFVLRLSAVPAKPTLPFVVSVLRKDSELPITETQFPL